MADLITQGEYKAAQNSIAVYSKKERELQSKISSLENEINNYVNSEGATIEGREILSTQLDEARDKLGIVNQALTDAYAISNSFSKQVTVPSASDEEKQAKQENASIVGDDPYVIPKPNTVGDDPYVIPAPNTIGADPYVIPASVIPPGAMPKQPKVGTVNFKSITGEQINQDMRVKIRVPDDYLTNLTSGPNNELGKLRGIIFPYTPTINIEHTAEYSTQNPLHSNYTIYFYRHSKVAPFNISGKFTVQNETEAGVYIATVHLLRALTKMRSGGSTGDFDSGSPPPICRLDAYGTMMLQNIPVAISSFKIELPDNVDYFTLGKVSGTGANAAYERTAVPVLSTINVTCIPMYSRSEMQKFNVSQWLTEKYVRKAGYL